MSERHAVVTGSASGIGRAARDALEAAGDRVLGVDLHDAEIECDLSTREGRDEAMSRIREQTGGGVDRLVLAAGLGGHVEDGPLVLSVNYFGSMDLLDGLLPAMQGRPGAAAVAVSSNSSKFGGPGDEPVVQALLDHDEATARARVGEKDGGAGYRTSKHALVRAVRQRAPRWGEAGVRLNLIVPGKTQTPIYQGAKDHPQMGRFVDRIPVPLGRIGTPEEMGAVIAFMVSDVAAYMHGSVVWVDGGMDAALHPDVF